MVPLGGKAALWKFDSNVTTRVTDAPVGKKASKWNIVLVPTGLCVLNILIGKLDVQSKSKTAIWYLVQIARSPDPFAKHETDETCAPASKTKIAALLAASESSINPDGNVTFSKSYVMIAPNCAEGKHVAPGHSGAYFFLRRV